MVGFLFLNTNVALFFYKFPQQNIIFNVLNIFIVLEVLPTKLIIEMAVNTLIMIFLKLLS